MSEIVGEFKCPLCGHMNAVVSSKQGRLTAVCKWQDDGCGSQLQAQMPEAVAKMRSAMTAVKLEEERAVEKGEVKVNLPPSPAQSDALGDWL